MIYDIIVIGSGISGMYSAYKAHKSNRNLNILILEKFKQEWIGGRTGNEEFCGETIVTGAGIGRYGKDKILHSLVSELELESHIFDVDFNHSKNINHINPKIIIDKLKTIKPNNLETFRNFAIRVLGEELYRDFILNIGYTDMENEDVYEVLHNYQLEDNMCCWKGFTVPWRTLIDKLLTASKAQIHFQQRVVKIIGDKSPYIVVTHSDSGISSEYYAKRIIVATEINTVQKLFSDPIYNLIQGQPFTRIYGKFTKKSIPILKKYIPKFTFTQPPIQKMIPINPDNGIYMIVYNDNNSAKILKEYGENNQFNRLFYCRLIEESLEITPNSLELVEIKSFYWYVGTHYFKPIDRNVFKSSDDILRLAQRPRPDILIVGEAFSTNQGWCEGALESVDAVM